MEVHARTEKADASKPIRLLRSCRPHNERPSRRTSKPAMNSRRRILILRVRSGEMPTAIEVVWKWDCTCMTVRRCARRSPEERYWITSSAVANSVSGMVRPSAFAVFMLMTSSNLVDCWTGRSAGLAPFRIGPTYWAAA
jgi:hypothetical protein